MGFRKHTPAIIPKDFLVVDSHEDAYDPFGVEDSVQMDLAKVLLDRVFQFIQKGVGDDHELDLSFPNGNGYLAMAEFSQIKRRDP